MKRQLLTMALAASALAPMAAQDQPAEKPRQTLQPSSPQVPLNVQFVLSRYKADKKISSTPYMLGVLSDSQKTSLRMGIQVPVTTTVFGGKTDGSVIPQSSYSYKDVGTNIDCQARSRGNQTYELIVTVQDSSIHLDQSASTANTGNQRQILRDAPAFRSFNASFAMTIRENQTMQYASAVDQVSGEVMRVDVTLSLAK